MSDRLPRIHPDTIQTVQQGVDIVDVISEHVVLNQRGKEYLGLCPFHNEKTPSFNVSQDKQVYYCFGCGEGGNVYKFLMEIGKQSFPEVVLDLARRYQIPVETVEPEQRQEIQRQLTVREQLYEIVAIANSFFEHALHQVPGEKALQYLKETRGLDDRTIKDFKLGYAPGGWETLYRYLVEQKRYPVSLAEEAGLIKKRKEGNGYYDVFRDRVVIPILDSQGRIIAFGSRSLKEEDKPKYLNSPDTPLFDKSKTVFAIDKARKSISQEDKVIVVEGYFDAITLHVSGFTNVVASLGTAFTGYQLKQLLRYTRSKQIILNFDTDKAGIKATERAISEVKDLVYSGEIQLRILNLPDGKDADELINNREDGIIVYRECINDARLWLDWQIDNLIKGKNLKLSTEVQSVAAGMIKLLNLLQDANQRNYYLNHCAEILSQGESRLVAQNLTNLKSQLSGNSKIDRRLKVKKKNNFKIKGRNKQNTINIAVSPEEDLLNEAESLLLLIYIHSPRYRDEITEQLEDKDLFFTVSCHHFLWQQIIKLESKIKEKDRQNELLRELINSSLDYPLEMQKVTKLFYLNEKTQEDIFRAKSRIEQAIASLEKVNCIKYENYCTKQLQELNPLLDSNKMTYLYQEIQYTKKRINDLEKIQISLNTD